MRSLLRFSLIVLFIAILPLALFGASRTSVALVGGAGIPIGWWSDRWSPFGSGELNLRYEAVPNAGLILIAGLSKGYLVNLSGNVIFSESNIGDIEPEFPKRIVNAHQGGNFKQMTTGFGLFGEREIGSLRAYGSVAMLIFNWKFERSQNLLLVVSRPPGISDPDSTQEDNWSVKQNGSNLGAQIAIGVLQPFRKNFYLDLSLAYSLVDISPKYGALAFWGYPIRTGTTKQRARISDANGRVNLLQIRVGVRYGG